MLCNTDYLTYNIHNTWIDLYNITNIVQKTEGEIFEEHNFNSFYRQPTFSFHCYLRQIISKNLDEITVRAGHATCFSPRIDYFFGGRNRMRM